MVGGGPAADGAVAGLRAAGFRGAIVMVAGEPWLPYERPHLSKGYLTGEVPPGRLPLRPEAQYEQLEVTIHHGQVSALHPEQRRVELEDGSEIPFELLLLATGAEPVPLPEVPGALYLRTRADADGVRSVLDGLTIVGAGFIGCEVAASARALGAAVTVCEALPVPMRRTLGDRLGAWLGGVHRSHGVDLRLGAPATPAEGPVLVAVGSRPRTSLAEQAGLECERGVLVDAIGQTSAPGVFAAGDCARFWSPLYEQHIRVEHFQTAQRHGYAVGRAMAGAGEPFGEAPWFWSDQYDLNLQYAGAGLGWDEEVVRGAFGEPPFSVFQLAGGSLVGVVGVNDHHTVSRSRRLLEARAAPTRAQLADPAFDLRRALR